MKPTNVLTRLMLVSLTALLMTFCASAQQPKAPVTIEYSKYLEMTKALNEGNICFQNLRMADSLYQLSLKEIDRKESVIVKLQQQRNTARDEAKLSQEALTSKDIFIQQQAETIGKLERKAKPKAWGIGITAGYGAAFTPGIKTVPFIGVGVTRTIIRF